MTDLFREIFSDVIGGSDLTEEQSYEIFIELMDGKLGDVCVAGLLSALATKGTALRKSPVPREPCGSVP